MNFSCSHARFNCALYILKEMDLLSSRQPVKLTGILYIYTIEQFLIETLDLNKLFKFTSFDGLVALTQILGKCGM